MEWGSNCSREISKTIGVVAFSDLIKVSTLFKCRQVLKHAFADIHIHQPDLHKEVSLEEIGADRDITVYNASGFWCRLKKSKEMYKNARKNKERLIKEYSSYNLEKSLKKMLNEKLR